MRLSWLASWAFLQLNLLVDAGGGNGIIGILQKLVLWHTEDKNIEQRKQLYTTEGKIYYKGNVFVPNDLEVIEL